MSLADVKTGAFRLAQEAAIVPFLPAEEIDHTGGPAVYIETWLPANGATRPGDHGNSDEE